MKRHSTSLLIFLILFIMFGVPNSFVLADGPTIDVWYGLEQSFGNQGIPQEWINIVGNVSDSDGIASLSYRLNNGEERPLTIGPDGRRLAEAGDFNIDIHIDELKDGQNNLIIHAKNDSGEETTAEVIINYANKSIAIESFANNWGEETNIQAQGQAVDGFWAVDDNGIRPIQIGYDRLYNMGDMQWDNYEVTIPVTVHGIDPVYDEVNIGSAVDVVVRWQGHAVWDDSQPAWGWWPFGAMAMYEWPQPDLFLTKLAGNKLVSLAETEHFSVEMNKPYMIKIRVETMPDLRSMYSFKSWPADQTEPDGWQFFGVQREWHPLNGSVLLVAHHADATFGNMTVKPVITNSFAQSLAPWDWFEQLSPILTQLPLILACLIGLFFVWRYRKTAKRAAQLTAVSLILLLLHLTVGTYLAQQLPYFLHESGMGTHRIGYSLGLFYFMQSTIVALALLLLIVAVFRWRQDNES